MALPPYDPSQVFRDNGPGGSPWEPIKQEIRVLLNWIVANLGGILVVKATKALLDADLAHAEGTSASVYADPTPANNGTYIKIGGSGSGSWSQTFSGADFADLAARIAASFPILTGGQTSINDLVEYNIAETEVTTGHNTQFLDRVVDDDGNTIFGVEPDAVTVSLPRLYYPGVSETWSGFSNYVERWVNDNGDTVAGTIINPDGSVTVLTPAPPAASYAEIDAQVQAQAARIREKKRFPQGARPVWQINGFLNVGESLSLGHGSGPALSRTPFLDMPGDASSNILMLGDSVHCAGTGTTTTWTPAGGSNTLKPAVATAMRFADGVLYSNEEAAALDWAADATTAKAESPLLGMLRNWRRPHLRHFGLGSDPNHQWLAQDVGISGETIANWKKGAGANYYNRARTAVQAAKAAATAAGKTYGLVAVTIELGANDYGLSLGAGPGWKTDFGQWCVDLQTDLAADAGQDEVPWIIINQTSGGWVRDNVNLQISMFQWEVCMEKAGVIMAGPFHPVTNRGDGHLDANGSRWMGVQEARTAYHAITLGEGVIPTMPVGVEVDGRTLRVRVATATGNRLTSGIVYSVSGALSLTSLGCKITDGAGAVTITGAAVTSATTVEFTLGRDVDPGTTVFWAGPQSPAFGCCQICDTDGFESYDNYVYTPADGMPTNKNIAALVNKPYGGDPGLQNFMVLSYLPAGWSAPSTWE